MKDISDFKLTNKVKVGALREWMGEKDAKAKQKITTFIFDRFHDRYLAHVQTKEGGFLRMAVCCLMIETIESFKQGVKNSKECSPRLFNEFFKSEKVYFPGFTGINFYKDIRCGILHQGETTSGWRILRSGDLLNRHERTINAKLFVEALSKSLDRYVQDLNSKDWNDLIWTNALLKLEDICNNCNF